ncbi:PQQ-binding-like beta-propeller repeat protein [Alienimonas chondri]|uniref:DNA damage-responsive serine/threonine-protein kinase RqkA n=1 Tax=Alienimonas chondri TaxID=2681879 RepID=A0ABX1V865_9PLAN|nr:PQQ-binding-like beta-propeller repeat protein [Alienimonas chondri]NNJ24373.1 DNA damage-responsive serine/threonine-protein kinase RqkA [Alienimonas chondri]
MRVLTAPVLLGCVLWGGSSATAGDWPSFRGNPQLTGATADTLPDEPKLLWTVEVPDGVAATAAIVGDHVFTAGLSGELHCRNIKDGTPIWTYQTEEVGKFRPGFLSSPAVADGRVYLGDEDGFMHAVDAQTGKKLWTFETGAEIISSPTVAEIKGSDGKPVSVVLFGSYDANLYCLDAKSGELRWQLETQGNVHCSPTVLRGEDGTARTFIAGCDEHLRGAEIADGSVTLDVEIGTYLIASPAAANGKVFFGTYAGDVLAVDAVIQSKPGANVPEAEAVVWRAPPEGQFEYKSSAAVTDDRVFVTGNDKVVKALDRETGKLVWETLLKAGSESSPVITGAGTARERVWFGGADRTLRSLNAKDGSEVWSQNLRKRIVASPAVGGPEGGTVLVIGTEGPNGAWFCFGG